MTAALSPTPQTRLLAPDLARGVMLLLIAMAYAGAYVGAGFATDASTGSALDRVATFASTLFLDNRAFPMFAILFGYGLAWSVARRSAHGADPTELRLRLRRRAWLLLAFGAVHAALVFPGEILTSYGLVILVTGWLLFRSDRALHVALALSGAFSLVMVPLIMSAAPEEEYAFPGYTSAEDWVDRIAGVPVSPVYIAIAYPLFFLVFVGYRAGRARLFEDTASRRRLLRLTAAAGIVLSVSGALPAAAITVGLWQPGSAVGGLVFALQILTGVAGGAGYAACFALGADALGRIVPRLTRAVAAVGKRSLTFYILNSVVVAVVLHPDLLAVGTQVGHFGALVVATAAWSAAILLAAWLERAGRTGPLEALMRRWGA